MATDQRVIIDSGELLSQSTQLQNLKTEYEAMFQNVGNILNAMNDGWSENLANNFAAKIGVAQKGFAKIVDMLECGEVVAKEAATSFEDINSVMARTISGGFSSLFSNLGPMLGTGVNMDMLFDFWDKMDESEAAGKFFDAFEKVGDFYDKLSDYEKELFGTEYLSQTGDYIDVISDLFTGKISGDGIEGLSNLVDLDGISESLGFSDGVGVGIIVEGLQRIFGDGENLSTIDPAMVDLCDDFESVKEAFENGNYVEGIAGAAFYSLEGGIRVVGDVVFDGALDAADKLITSAVGFNPIEELQEVIPWDAVNDKIQDMTGIDFSTAIPEFGQNMIEEFGNRVDETVEGSQIIFDYVGEQVASGIEYIKDWTQNIWPI